MSTVSPTLSIVVPCYKSADCLAALAAAVQDALAGVPFELILVDDGSADGTWATIRTLASGNGWVKGIQHRRNFGQDAAVMTGIRHAAGRFVVIMDDDLQHDPKDIPRLLDTAERGDFDVVYAAFTSKKHRAWKNVGSWFNGKVAEWLVNKPPHIYFSPFKIIRGEVAREAAQYAGPLPYVDPLLLQVTNRLGQIQVAHHDRFAGASNYSFRRSVERWARLAFSFSLKPLRLSMWGGALFSLLGLSGAVAVVLYRLFSGDDVSHEAAGWASTMATILTFGGMQMVFTGILGEYVGRSHITIAQAPQSSISGRTFDPSTGG